MTGTSPPLTARVAAFGVLLLLGCLEVSAQTASSGLFRIEGTGLPAGAGRATGPGRVLDQIIAQPEPFGDSAGAAGTVLHGWRFPPVVERLYRYALAAGWNLKGAPGVSDHTTGHIFTGPAGAPIKIGNIQYPTLDGGFVEADDGDPLLGLQAFWVFSYWGGQGQSFRTPEAHRPDDGVPWQDLLEPGWNLFSPPYMITVPPRGRIVVVWRWDTATAAYVVVAPGQIMLPLQGYWIFVLDQES
jgi:hypothetical protein